MKQKFYSWMPFLVPVLIISTGTDHQYRKAGCFFSIDTISKTRKSQSPGTRQTKDQNLNTAEGIHRPLLGP